MDHKCLHKVNFINIKTKEQRAELQKNRRANKRDELHATNRNISIDEENEENIIPQSHRKRRRSSVIKNTLSASERFNQKFLRWKQEKALKLKKEIKKPAFISSVPSGRFLPSKENEKLQKFSQPIQPTITVKPITVQNIPQIKIKKEKSSTKKLENLKKEKVIKFDAIQEPLFKMPVKLDKVNKKLEPPKLTPITSTDKVFQFVVDGELVTSTNRKFTTEKSIAKLEIKNENDTLTGISPIEPFTPEKSTKQCSENIIDQLNTSSNQYLSPFVSTARGKGSVTREIKRRSTVYKLQSEEPKLTDAERKTKAACTYFRNSLNTEINRLNNIANKWHLYKNDTTDLIDDAIDMIDVAVGQTRLLISKKFEQFRKLIDQCENKVSNQTVLPDDLEGFWAMLYLQIENLNKRYDNLERYKINSWIDPDLIIDATIKIKKERKKKVKTVKPSFDIKSMIKKAQMNLREKQKHRTEVHSILTETNKRNSGQKKSSSKKSILKTPGVDKLTRNKSVIFSSPSNENIINGYNDNNESNSNKRINFKELSPETPMKIISKKSPKKKIICTPMPKVHSQNDSVHNENSVNRRRSNRTPKPRISLCDLPHSDENSSKRIRKTLKFIETDQTNTPSNSVNYNTEINETPVSSMKPEKILRKSNRKMK